MYSQLVLNKDNNHNVEHRLSIVYWLLIQYADLIWIYYPCGQHNMYENS
jgi:hypothetical protein